MGDKIILRKMQPQLDKDPYLSVRMIYPLVFLSEDLKAQIKTGKTPYALMMRFGDSIIMKVLISENEKPNKDRMSLAQEMIDNLNKELNNSSVRIVQNEVSGEDCSAITERVKAKSKETSDFVSEIRATSKATVKKLEANPKLSAEDRIKVAKSKAFIEVADAFLLFLKEIEEAAEAEK